MTHHASYRRLVGQYTTDNGILGNNNNPYAPCGAHTAAPRFYSLRFVAKGKGTKFAIGLSVIIIVAANCGKEPPRIIRFMIEHECVFVPSVRHGG
jgi:hypothetical protein